MERITQEALDLQPMEEQKALEADMDAVVSENLPAWKELSDTEQVAAWIARHRTTAEG